jgi:YD repeat-containing protein
MLVQTVGAETISVVRTFDPANRLQTALDNEQGTSSYYFDNAGNLVEILPPGASGQEPHGRLRYDYDPLYRLTSASYTGDIEAGYSYVYDGVGNMTAYTETVGAETTSMVRAFDAANRLETSNDGRGGHCHQEIERPPVARAASR